MTKNNGPGKLPSFARTPSGMLSQAKPYLGAWMNGSKA